MRLGRVPLLLRTVLIVAQDLIDDPRERIQLRAADRLHAAIPGRQPVAQHLAYRLPREPEAPRRRPLAQPLDVNAAPHLRIELHSIHPSCVPQNTLGMLGGPLKRSGVPPPSGGFQPPIYGLFLLRRSHPSDLKRRVAIMCGAGTGWFSLRATERGARVTAVDIGQALLKIVRDTCVVVLEAIWRRRKHLVEPK